MTNIITPKQLGPKVVTLGQLRKTLLRYTHGWTWAEGAITDLWLLGAPVPKKSLHEPEQRVLMPAQFMKWWSEVQQRMGYDATSLQVHQQIP